MGNLALQQVAQALSVLQPRQNSEPSQPIRLSAPSPPKASDRATQAAGLADSLGGDPGLQVDEAFNGTVYYAQMEQVSLAVRLQEVRSQIAAAQDAQAQGVTGEQLTFNFFGEVRSEEAAVFRQRTDAVAQGLGGARQETYIEASRRVAARFEFSLSISGAALNGFAGASEGIQGGDPAMFDAFLGLAKDTLKNTDDIVNAVFDLLGAFFSGKGDLGASFTKLVDQIFGSGLLGGSPASDSTGAKNTGSGQSIRLGVQLEFKFAFSVEGEAGEVQQSDPIALDLNDNGIDLTSYTNGARFDIVGNGRIATTAFVTGGDAFLAMDRNGNGIVDSGRELFGDQNGAANGYAELAKLDANHDWRINRLDPDFSKLLLFKDNGNGKTEPGELVSLIDAGIVELDLSYQQVTIQAAGGNRIAQVASYRRADGANGRTADAILNFTV
jgi:hypothetical protein